MTTVYVREQGATVRTRGQRLLVTKKGEKLMDLPLRHLEQLAVVGNVQVTTPAVAALLQGEIDVVFFSSRFRYRGRLLATGSKFAALRQAQLRVMSDERQSLPIARTLVAGKLANQRTVLLRRRRREESADLVSALDRAIQGIRDMGRAAGDARSLDSLRGHEGKGAAHYFGALKTLLDPAWGFERRAYYPPPDPVNAALSFGYALLLKDATSAAQLVGLDPYLGFLHAVHYGRPSLALDVMEEFRPVLVDALVLSLIERGQLTPRSFIRRADERRPIELSPAALDDYLAAYERRLAERIRHPAADQQVTWRRCIELQCRQLANVVMGKTSSYVPVTVR